MSDAQAAFIHSPELERYAYPPQCPFSTARAPKARTTLAGMGLLSGPDRRELPPRPAAREELLRFHRREYLDILARASLGDMDESGLHAGLGTEETPVFLGLYDYAVLAAGATLTGADAILAGEASVAFNPSGGYHHAHPARASGFCYINDVALGCDHLARAGRRVAFVDIDAHHCDGVQDFFYARGDVLTISFHESGTTLFPGTGFEHEVGTGDGEGCTVNVPLPENVHDEAFEAAFRAVAPPILRAWRPDVIVLEVGMDCLSGDPLTHLSLTNNAYAEAIGEIKALGLPVLATGGGGYHVENTARGWALTWAALCGDLAETDAMSLGLGGVMMETTDHLGGLRDRRLAPDADQRAAVDAAVEATLKNVRKNVFQYHGL